MKIKSLKSSLQLLALIFIAMHFASCLNYKNVPYFTDLPQTDTIAQILNPYQCPTIQKNDIISITVGSISPESNAIFSFNAGTSGSIAAYSTGSSYMVDMEGYIEMPLVSKIKVEGLTTKQVKDLLQEKLSAYLKEPVVEVRITNFKIAVLGAVGAPGMLVVTNERVTVMDAISMAGDLELDAQRDNVLLIREEDGARKQIRMNLNSSEVLNSPYYYLRNNDIIYVQPGKFGTRDINFRSLTYLITVISVLTFLQTLIK
ncbi:MAG: polysaccharide biosynthesis/export family protein [Arcticibacter sp.]